MVGEQYQPPFFIYKIQNLPLYVGLPISMDSIALGGAIEVTVTSNNSLSSFSDKS